MRVGAHDVDHGHEPGGVEQNRVVGFESATLALARPGHTERAAAILGHLEAHSHVFGYERILEFRERARELVDADGGHPEARGRGPRMTSGRSRRKRPGLHRRLSHECRDRRGELDGHVSLNAVTGFFEVDDLRLGHAPE